MISRITHKINLQLLPSPIPDSHNKTVGHSTHSKCQGIVIKNRNTRKSFRFYKKIKIKLLDFYLIIQKLSVVYNQQTTTSNPNDQSLIWGVQQGGFNWISLLLFFEKTTTFINIYRVKCLGLKLKHRTTWDQSAHLYLKLCWRLATNFTIYMTICFKQ